MRLFASSLALMAVLGCDALPAARVPADGPAGRAGRASLLSAFEDRASFARRQWEHLAKRDGDACRAALREAGVKFRALPDREGPDAKGCGIPHGVVVERGPTGIAYQRPLVVDCSLALTLPAFERAVQDAATAELGAPVRRIVTMGTYACRPIRGREARLSEHAFGNAVDLARFELARGKAAVVARDYREDAGSSPRGRFLRSLFDRLRHEPSITHVIGPAQSRSHADHLHVDRALRGGLG
jgi:hypothetical protein